MAESVTSENDVHTTTVVADNSASPFIWSASTKLETAVGVADKIMTARNSIPVKPIDLPTPQQIAGQTKHFNIVGAIAPVQALDADIETSWLPIPINAMANADAPMISQT